MVAGGEGGAMQDEVGGVLRCSETQLAGASASSSSQPTSILTRKLVLVVAC